MPIFDVSAYAAALKEKYGPALVSQVNDKITALKLFSEDTESWEGLYVRYPVLLSRAQSFMAHGSLGLLPTSQNELTADVQIPVKWVRGTVTFEVAVMKASARSSGAWARAQKLLMDRLVTNISDELNRMLSAGTGRGILAFVDDADGSSAGVLEVDAPGGIASDGFGSRYLQPGMIIAFVDPSTQTIRSIRQVVAINQETATLSSITLNSDVNTSQAADNDWIVRAADFSVTNTARDTSLDNEPMGLEGIVDDGTLVSVFHNISRSTYPAWQSTVLSVPSLSLDALQRLYDTIDQQSGEMPTDNLVHHSVRRAYLASIEASRIFMQSGKGPAAFDLGQEPAGLQLTYNGVPIHVDKDVQFGRWLAVNRNHLTKFTLVPGEWADETGSVFQAVPGQDALQAIYRIACNYSSDKPNAHGKLVDMSITNAITRHVV